MQKLSTVILGAGFSGLGAAWAAERKATIFEQNDTWGGLCGNFSIDGFRFDKAVHLSFSQNKIVQDLFYKTPYVEHKPEAQNYADGYWVRHPVQSNSCTLPVEERIRIIKSFINRPSTDKKAPETYDQWLVQQFGSYFATRYPGRYTKKYWATEAGKLNCNWCGGRLYKPSLDEVLRGAFTDKTPNTYYAKVMRYPKIGGYRAFLAPFLTGMDIRYGKKAVAIDTKRKIVQFSDQSEYGYDTVISTIPLPALVKMMPHPPADVIAAADSLEATSMQLVSIGFKKKIRFPSLWFYVYDENIPFARVYSPSMKSDDNAPEGKSSLQCEIYYSKAKPVSDSDETLRDKTITALCSMGLITRDDILFADVRYEPYANVIFYSGMEQNRDICRTYLKKEGIRTAGRFGEWDYLWSDQSFLSGYTAAK